jgi:eukaryotic-like serine/threonine-protein kinase
MTRPQTVQDVLDALQRDRLVESARLCAFLGRHSPVDAAATLARLVGDGLLTPYQADEVAAGRGDGLWLGAYRVLNRLGKGGMGHVYLAEHAVLGRLVAVKVLSDSLRADPGARRRFVREARAAAALDHPNIVHVSDVNMNHEPPYLVMEYVDGVSLQAAVAQAGTFAVGETAAVGVQVGDGLARAAAVGLVHRDIKPANLLVDRRGAVKILDLGIVRFTQEDTHSRIHATELILGTLDYLAPEQAEDSSKVDTRADLYALGATLYFLLAGHPPFPGTDVRRKLVAKRNEDPPPIHCLRPDVSDEFSAVVHRLLARDPADRYPNPAALVAALHPWAAPGPDFPARLFRLSSDSTAHERRHTDHQPNEPMPETLRIIKPQARPAAPGPSGTVGPGSDAAGTAGGTPHGFPGPAAAPPGGAEELPAAETENVSANAALTDEELAVPPELLAPLPVLVSIPPTAPAAPDVVPVVAPRPRRPLAAPARIGVWWQILIALALAALVVSAGTALVLLSGR